jgi:hypothetical protein
VSLAITQIISIQNKHMNVYRWLTDSCQKGEATTKSANKGIGKEIVGTHIMQHSALRRWDMPLHSLNLRRPFRLPSKDYCAVWE